MISDQELVARVTGFNDQAAFQLLVERHQSAIRGFLRRLLAGDHGTADDLAQDTFLMAYRKLHTLKAGGSLVSWLHTIAYRQFLGFRQKQSRQQVMADPPQQGHAPRAAVDASILLPKLLQQVSDAQRACLTLAYAEGMSHAEISDITGIPLGSVKAHIHRGKLKLQRWLKENDHSISKEPGRQGPENTREAHRV